MSNVPRSEPIPIPARRGEEYFVPWRQFSKGRSVVEECRAFPRAQSVSREDLEYFLRSVHYRCDYVRLRARRRLEDNGNGGDDWADLPNYSTDVTRPSPQRSAAVVREARRVLETVEEAEEECEIKEEVEMVEIADKDKQLPVVGSEREEAKDEKQRVARPRASSLPRCVLM